MHAGAMLVEKLWSDGKRLRPRAVVAEFEKTLQRRARPHARGGELLAAAPQLPALAAAARPRGALGLLRHRSDGDGADGGHPDRRRSTGCARPASTSSGSRAPASRSSSRRCSATATSTPTCTRATSSSRPMPPHHGKYIALDFGIMGTLSERDQSYLAQNFLAFFRRDYHRVATAHLESGWVPPDTRVDELEAEIRVVLRAGLRPAALGDLARPRAAAALPRVAPLQRRDPAAARAAAEDAAQRRRPRPAARSRPRPVGDRACRISSDGCTSGSGCRRSSGACSPRRRTSSRRCPSCRASSISGCSARHAVADDAIADSLRCAARAERAAARCSRVRWRLVAECCSRSAMRCLAAGVRDLAPEMSRRISASGARCRNAFDSPSIRCTRSSSAGIVERVRARTRASRTRSGRRCASVTSIDAALVIGARTRSRPSSPARSWKTPCRTTSRSSCSIS